MNSIVGKEVEMNWGTIRFKGIVLTDNEDFTFDVKVTESNTDKIAVGIVKSVMGDDITGIK